MTPAQERQLATLWERVERLSRLAESKADHHLQIADRLERNTAAQDRGTDALLRVRQELTELRQQHEWVRGAFTDIAAKLAILSKDLDEVEAAQRESTGQHKLVVPQDKDPWYSRIFVKLLDAPARTQIFFLILLLVLVLAALHGGVQAFLQLTPGNKEHKHVTEP